MPAANLSPSFNTHTHINGSKQIGPAILTYTNHLGLNESESFMATLYCAQLYILLLFLGRSPADLWAGRGACPKGRTAEENVHNLKPFCLIKNNANNKRLGLMKAVKSMDSLGRGT